MRTVVPSLVVDFLSSRQARERRAVFLSDCGLPLMGFADAWGDVPSNDSSVAMLNGEFLYGLGGSSPMGVFIAECKNGVDCQLLSTGWLNPMARSNRTWVLRT